MELQILAFVLVSLHCTQVYMWHTYISMLHMSLYYAACSTRICDSAWHSFIVVIDYCCPPYPSSPRSPSCCCLCLMCNTDKLLLLLLHRRRNACTVIFRWHRWLYFLWFHWGTLFIYLFNFFSHFNTSVLINQNTVTIIVIW